MIKVEVREWSGRGAPAGKPKTDAKPESEEILRFRLRVSVAIARELSRGRLYLSFAGVVSDVK